MQKSRLALFDVFWGKKGYMWILYNSLVQYKTIWCSEDVTPYKKLVCCNIKNNQTIHTINYFHMSIPYNSVFGFHFIKLYEPIYLSNHVTIQFKLFIYWVNDIIVDAQLPCIIGNVCMYILHKLDRWYVCCLSYLLINRYQTLVKRDR